MIFAMPTSALVWFTTNKYLSFWGSGDVFIGSSGFWAIFAIFAFMSLLFPRLFPSFLGNSWKGLMKIGKWL